MQTSPWKLGLAAILTTGIMVAGATAQEGASSDVTIKDKAPAVTATDKAPPDDARPVKPTIVERDPFVNQIFASKVTPRNIVRPNPKPLNPGNSSVEPQGRPDADPIATQTEVPEEVPAPEVTVSGIVTSPSGSLAIILTSVGTRMISAGEKLGDYRVSSIGTDHVAFRYGDYKVFKVPMASEF